MWQQNPWNVISDKRSNSGIAKHNQTTVTKRDSKTYDISNKRSNPGIAKHNQTSATKRDSKTYETSFPMPRATLRLLNVIRLPVMWLEELFLTKIAHTLICWATSNKIFCTEQVPEC